MRAGSTFKQDTCLDKNEELTRNKEDFLLLLLMMMMMMMVMIMIMVIVLILTMMMTIQ